MDTELKMTVELYDQNNTIHTLAEYKGKRIILFFYPKDNTPGCTKEAVGFNELDDQFRKKNCVVIGVSKDSVKSHQKFVKKYDLEITLLSDPDMKLISKYEVWREKKNYGKTYMGIVRTTVLLDENGFVDKYWDNVKVRGHVQDVLDYVAAKG